RAEHLGRPCLRRRRDGIGRRGGPESPRPWLSSRGTRLGRIPWRSRGDRLPRLPHRLARSLGGSARSAHHACSLVQTVRLRKGVGGNVRRGALSPCSASLAIIRWFGQGLLTVS